MVVVVDLIWLCCFGGIVIDAVVRIGCWIIWFLFACWDGMRWLFNLFLLIRLRYCVGGDRDE